MNILLVYIAFDLLFAVLILWAASRYMLQEKRMPPFLPFVFLGIMSAFSAGFVFFGVFLNAFWFFIEITNALFLVWVLLFLFYYDQST